MIFAAGSSLFLLNLPEFQSYIESFFEKNHLFIKLFTGHEEIRALSGHLGLFFSAIAVIMFLVSILVTGHIIGTVATLLLDRIFIQKIRGFPYIHQLALKQTYI